MVKLESYWQTNSGWVHFEKTGYVINNNTPEEAKRSYQINLKQLADIDRRTQRYLVIPKNQDGIDEYEDHDPDWMRESFETDSLKVFLIPYEEFCEIREPLPIEDYLHEDSHRMYDAEIERYLALLDKNGMAVPQIKAVLTEALRYHTFVEFVETHIL